nr:unnamed protein product [Spirometra erinaceieuropaei]
MMRKSTTTKRIHVQITASAPSPLWGTQQTSSEATVKMSDVQSCSEYIAPAFWKSLHEISLLHVACLFSAHEAISMFLNMPNNTYHTHFPQEGTSSVHIASALGDYAALHRLLQYGRNSLLQDKLGRSPLHYAAQTNLETVMMLLASQRLLLHQVDHADKLPVDFCVDPSVARVLELLKMQTTLDLEEQAQDSVFDDGDATFSTVRSNLRYRHYYNKKTYCHCCDEMDQHEVFSNKEALNMLIQSRRAKFIKRPTNTFGQFETPCSTAMAEFVRMTDDTPMESLENLFFRIWKLSRPELVLTFHGSFPRLKSFHRCFWSNVFPILQKSLTWVITDGQLDSAAELMTVGMNGYVEAYGLKQLQVIGVVPWRRLPCQASMRCTNYTGYTQVAFPTRDQKSHLHTPLAPNHTRYLFIDTADRNDIHCTETYRAELETWLSNVTDEEKEHKTPVCGLLFAGRPEHLPGVLLALQRNIPFVILAETGGLATVLDLCVTERNYMREVNGSYDDDDLEMIDTDMDQLSDRIQEIALRVWDKKDLEEDTVSLVIETLKYTHLLEFSHSEGSSCKDLDVKLVSSLTNPALFKETHPRHSWKAKLRIAVQLNRTDAVLERILADSHWTVQEMTPFVKSCLLANKVQFIRLLADIGYPLHTFATEKIMEELFTVEAHKKTLGGQNLQMFLLSYRSKVPDIVTVSLVKTILRRIMGRHCFTSFETQEAYHHSDFLFHGGADDKNSMIYTSSLADENGFQYLFVWSLVTKRFQIAQFLLLHMTEICAAALFAAEFLRQMSRLYYTPSERGELERVAIIFEDAAVGILTECYLNNMETTMVLLVMERPAFGKLSALMLAARGYSYKFMEHSACQEYMNRVWLNTLAQKGNSLSFFIALIFGIVCPLAVPFIVEYDDSKYKSLPQETKDEFSNFEVGRKQARRLVYTHIRKICDFYRAPCVRYSYHLSLSDRHSRESFFSSRSNQYVILVFLCFILGTILQALISHYDLDANGLEQFSRACLVFSATGPFLRLLMLFSINQNIGPKLQMIRHMLKKDMLPFLLILIVFWLMYSVLFATVIYRPGDIEDPLSPMILLSSILRRNFFQMFGEFDSEENLQSVIHGTCKNNTQYLCSYSSSAYWIVALQSVFTLMNNLLLINLLIAIFTKRYDRMEAASQKLWAMQRYLMMDSLLRQAVLPAPLVLFSHIHLLFKAIRNRVFSTVEEEQSPFRKSFCRNPARERQLIHWEKLRAVIYLASMVEDNNDIIETTAGFTAPDAPTGDRGHAAAPVNSWKRVHHLVNPVVAFREVLKNAEVRSSLEQKINTIHDGVSFLRNTIGKFQEGSETHCKRGVSLLTASPRGAHSMESLACLSTAPTVFFADGHWLAIYAAFSSDLVPHIFDEPLPWEDSFPSYCPITWRPSRQCVPKWGSQELEAPRVRERLSIWSADSSQVEIYVARNPGGRVGIMGRGLLPELGPNHGYTLIIGARAEMSSTEWQVLILTGSHRPAQFPWFLCKHPTACDTKSCSRALVRRFCEKMSEVATQRGDFTESEIGTVIDRLLGCPLSVVEVGYVADPINCDNAWLEITAIRINVTAAVESNTKLLKIFPIEGSKASWVDENDLPEMRKSHLKAFQCYRSQMN